MDAIRCKGQQRGFRVGEILFRYDLWTPVEEVTDDMRVEGMLQIVKDVTGPDDPRLFPFALITEDDRPPLSMEEIRLAVTEIQKSKTVLDAHLRDLSDQNAVMVGQVSALQADKASLGGQVITLQEQITAMQATDGAQKKQITDLIKRVGELEAAAKAAVPVTIVQATEAPPTPTVVMITPGQSATA
jgi:hypothetical protein